MADPTRPGSKKFDPGPITTIKSYFTLDFLSGNPVRLYLDLGWDLKATFNFTHLLSKKTF